MGNSLTMANPVDSSRIELLWIHNGQKYVDAIDQATLNFSDQKLEAIQKRINSYSKDSSKISEKNQKILLYLNKTVTHEIQSRKDSADIQKILSSQDLTQQEREDTKNAILSLQNLLLGEMQNIEEAFLAEWKKSSHIRAEGDMSIDMNLKLMDEIDIQMGMKLNDYISESHIFDQTFKSKIEWFYKDMSGEKNEEHRISSLIDFISKDGNIYMLFENLKLSSDNKDMQKAFDIINEKLNNLAQSKTYLSQKQGGADIQAFLNMWKNVDASAYKEFVWNNALLQAYKKSDNSYDLIPTKAFCDLGKKISGVFDPLSPKECSEKQYQKLVKQFISSGSNLSLELGNSSILRFSNTDFNSQINTSLSWSTRTLQNMNLEAYKISNPKNNYVKINWDFWKLVDLSYIIDEISGNGKILFLNRTIDSFEFKTQGKDIDFKMSYLKSIFDASLNVGDLEDYVKCNLNGTLKSQKVDLLGNCEIQGNFISLFVPNEQKIDINMKLSGESMNSQNNVYFELSAQSKEKKILELEIKNKGSKTLIKENTIKAPAKTQDIETFTQEVFEESMGTMDPMY